MKTFIVRTLQFFVSLAGSIFLLFPLKHRVVFSSYFHSKPQGNMRLILAEGRKRGLTVVENFNKYNNTFSGRGRYLLHLLKELYYFNTSRVIVLDGNSFILSSLKKNERIKSIQLWHATGAFKKFGNDTKRIYKIRNLDYAITSGEHLRSIFAKALNVDIDNVLPLGVPRLDPMFNPKKVEEYRAEVIARYKELAGKKVILYAPTFRGKGANDIQVPDIDLNRVAKSICDEYVIAIRMHPLMAGYSDYNQFIDLSNEGLIKTLCATDILITDYSSIIFEFSALKRPMLFFTPDLEQYLNDRGFYEEYETFVPGRICRTEEELITSIKHKEFEQEKVEPFANRYLNGGNGSSATRITELIEKLLLDDKPL